MDGQTPAPAPAAGLEATSPPNVADSEIPAEELVAEIEQQAEDIADTAVAEAQRGAIEHAVDPLGALIAAAAKLKDAGTKQFRGKCYMRAAQDYSATTLVLESITGDGEVEHQVVKDARRNAYGNLAAAWLPLKAWAAALAAATEAANIDNTWHKAHYRRGLALEGLANECAATYGSELKFREDEDEALVAQAEKMKKEGAMEEQRLLTASMATFRAAQMWAQATMQPASADKQTRVALARVADRLDVLTGQGSGKEARAELEKELARDERERKMDPVEQSCEGAESLSKATKSN